MNLISQKEREGEAKGESKADGSAALLPSPPPT